MVRSYGEDCRSGLPVLATVISVGVLVNIMAATGVKGLLAITFITLPMAFIYVTALIFAPFSQGALSYGSAIYSWYTNNIPF
jgi:CitMHS family citrate-Mg2+:H+ or citrate-Ca2+:H+ symporter